MTYTKKSITELNLEVMEHNRELILNNVEILNSNYAKIKSLYYKAQIKNDKTPGKVIYTPCLMSKLKQLSDGIEGTAGNLQFSINGVEVAVDYTYHDQVMRSDNPECDLSMIRIKDQMNQLTAEDSVDTFKQDFNVLNVFCNAFEQEMAKLITRLRCINGENFPKDVFKYLDKIKDIASDVQELHAYSYEDDTNSISDDTPVLN